MKKILYFSPWLLLFSRLLIAIIFLGYAFFPESILNDRYLLLFLFCFGFIGDIFDGIIARALKIDTTLMRRLDSLFDTLFWLITTYLLIQISEESALLKYGIGAIIAVVALEYGVSLVRFSKPPSSHNLLSKFFGLTLFTFYILLFLGVQANGFGFFVVVFGLIARLDALCIYLTLKKWTHDIPSVYHAYLLRKGESFSRNALFHSAESAH